MQGNVPGSSRGSTAFNVFDEAQTITLLKLVRHSTLDNETKDDIRDILFEMRTNADQSLVQELQLYVDPLNVTVSYDAQQVAEPQAASTPAAPVAASEPVIVTPAEVPSAPVPEPVVASPVPRYVSTTGRTRPVPAMGIMAASQVVVPTVTSPTSKEQTINTPASAPKSENVVVPVPPAPVATPSVADITPATEVQIPEESEEKKLFVKSVTEFAGVPIVPEVAQARITEIKHIVNSAVGNPVNLIDADNTVGREYMNALLEAMKASSGGGAALTVAMQRLEAAFVAVQAILPNVAKPEAAPEPVASPEPEVIESEPEVVPEQAPQFAKVEPASEIAKEFVADVNPEPPSIPQVPSVPGASVSSDEHQSVAEVAAAWQQAAVAAAPAPLAPEVITDELQSKQITAGLTQLLNEWKLFKSSGLFGTGPHGIEHPLFKEIRNLNMNLVITGRFEGATAEVRQSINDYMNGWRYEQGMTHDMQETFEHYLRRVIKSIIDKRPSVGV